MMKTDTELIDELRRSRGRIAEIEALLEERRIELPRASEMCCQARGADWWEVCDLCIDTGEAFERLDDRAIGIIDLYNARSQPGREDAWLSGAYREFVDQAAHDVRETVFETLLHSWPLGFPYYTCDDPAERARILTAWTEMEPAEQARFVQEWNEEEVRQAEELLRWFRQETDTRDVPDRSTSSGTRPTKGTTHKPPRAAGADDADVRGEGASTVWSASRPEDVQ